MHVLVLRKYCTHYILWLPNCKISTGALSFSEPNFQFTRIEASTSCTSLIVQVVLALTSCIHGWNRWVFCIVLINIIFLVCIDIKHCSTPKMSRMMVIIGVWFRIVSCFRLVQVLGCFKVLFLGCYKCLG